MPFLQNNAGRLTHILELTQIKECRYEILRDLF
jgi:hypothetical protein